MKRNKQPWLNRLACLVLLAPLLAWAQSGQFYFLARTAPIGSLSAPGQNTEAVYLRWDALEGDLPDDVERLRLLRDGDVLLDTAVDAVMTAAEISALYQGDAQQRRLLETVTLLQEAEAGSGQSVSANLFAGVLRQRLQTDANWAFLASRSDFNVARARYRGYLDQPGAGTFTYELQAVDGGGATARLGRAVVDTHRTQQVRAPSRFEQVSQAQCDAPEYAKDHYTVAIDWNAPGVGNVTDRLASQLWVSGYDLYRTTDNLDPNIGSAPNRDIAALAANADHDNRGRVRIAGLEKVNDVLLTLSPDDNELTPEWLETHDDLAKAGLQPGDHRAYYLVPRDFTGHYGPTVATLVTVPNLTRPAKPWDIRVFADDTAADKNLAVSFDRVTLANYLDVYEDNYRICNPAAAAQNGVLEYVGKNESCQDATRRSLRLDVTDYKIYRFDSFEMASRFIDSDGDGVSDARERDINDDGTVDDDEREKAYQCDPSQQPGGAVSRMVEPASVNLRVTTLDSGRERMRFQDEVPATKSNRDDGRVFWYRFASETADKRLSLLTSPQRALFPNRALPASPTVSAERTVQQLCSCSLRATGGSDAWSFIDDLQRGGEVNFSCDGQAFTASPSDLQAGSDFCRSKDVITACSGSTTSQIGYSEPLTGAGVSCQTSLPGDVDICGQGEVRLKPEYCPAREAVPGIGSAISGPFHVVVDAPTADSCVSLYRLVDGRESRVATSCGTDTPGRIDYQAERGLFCGYAVTHDGNNNVSVPTDVPCTLIRPEDDKAPTTPQLVSVDVSASEAEVSWRLPVEPVAATLVEIRHTDVDGNRVVSLNSVPVAGLGAGEVQSHSESVPALSGAEDEWCVRLRAVSPASVDRESRSSQWSAPRCTTRTAQAETAPEYLPWPNQPALAQGPDLQAHLGIEFLDSGRLDLNSLNMFIKLGRVEDIEVNLNEGSGECFVEDVIPTNPNLLRLFPQVECTTAGMNRVQASILPRLNFTVYRQGRAPDGTLGEWIQVSPLIDYVHWDDITPEDPDKVKRRVNARLNDPYIKLFDVQAEANTWQSVFVDRYPYITGHDYRFQLVFFSDDHRLARWRQSNWLSADSQAAQATDQQEVLQ